MVRTGIGIIYLCIFLFVHLSCFAQITSSSDRKNHAFSKALDYAEAQNYAKAIDALSELIAENPQVAEYYLHLGLCYLNTTNGANNAALTLKKGLDLLNEADWTSDLGIDFQLTLGKTYQVLLKPKDALAIYDYLQQNLSGNDSELQAIVQHEIDNCKNASVFLAHPTDLTIYNLGPQVNSKYDDHSPLVTVFQDILYFTSRRPAPRLSRLEDGQFPEKVYYTARNKNEWENANPLQIFFKNNDHESALSISADGKELFIFHNDRGGQNLYMSEFIDHNWQEPRKLPAPINSEANETHASLSADKSTLYFTSDREGGLGGIDIYMIKKDANGNWGEPQNLGPHVNTPFDEETPMIHPDGKTLYFSSEGHNSMGRMDVFYTQKYPDNSWATPVNLGYPINTPDDDFFFVPTLNKHEAYYSSARLTDNYGGSDLYKVVFNESPGGELAVIEGHISDASAIGSPQVRILVTRRTDHQLVGDYRPNLTDGSYLLFLESGHEYEIEEQKAEEHILSSLLNIPEEETYQRGKPFISFEEIRMDPPLQPLLANLNKETKKIDDAVNNNIKKVIEEEPFYTIQVLALKHRPIFASMYLKGLDRKEIKTYPCSDGYTRYIFGAYKGKMAALKAREQLLKSDKFTDSFVRPLADLDSLHSQKIP